MAKENRQIVEGTVKGTNFRGAVNYREHSKKPHFDAKTHLITKDIYVGYNPEYEKNGRSPVNALIDIPYHEMGHHGFEETKFARGVKNIFYGCPRNADLGRKLIFEPIYEVLRQNGFSQNDAHYVENTFEDTLLQADLARAHKLDGIVDFFEDVAETSDKGFGDYYEAHVKLNMFLWGTKDQKRKVGKYFKNNEQVRGVIQNFLKRSGIMDLQQRIDCYERRREQRDANGKVVGAIERRDQEANVRDKDRIRDFLMDEKNWSRLAKIYAEEFSKLMKPGYAMPVPNHSGGGTQGREGEANPEDGNVFQNEADGEDYQRGRVQEVYDSGESLPNWMSDSKEHKINSLRLLYQSLARKLNIKAESRTQTFALPVAHFGKRDYDPLKDNPKGITLVSDMSGDLTWKKKRFKVETPMQVRQSSKGFPSVRYAMIDLSSSMLSSPAEGTDVGSKKIIPWGDNSKYHYAILGWIGFLEYLKANQLLNPREVELWGFGSSTRSRKGLENAMNFALNPSFDDDTRIDPDKLAGLFEGKDNLIFTVSDGEIANWSQIENIIVDGAKRNHYFHLQIGSDSFASIRMRENGIVVPVVKGYNDLAKTTVDLTRKIRQGGKL